MGSCWALVCSTAFLLVLLSSASQDDRNMEQREVTFDIDKIMQEMQDYSFTGQKIVDFTDLLDPEEFPIEQVRVPPPEQYDTLSERGGSSQGVLTPRGRRPSFPPSEKYPVQFPLGRPTSDNLQAICLNGDRRPRYTDSYFPASGYGDLKRRASAINKAEFWFDTCCKGNQTWGGEVTLCCATQAWELSVQSFCEDNARVKDRQYYCCKQGGSDRLNCFHNAAPNPNYEATEDLPMPPLPSTAEFNFDTSTCQSQRTVMTPQSVRADKNRKEKKPSVSKKVDITFPPARPTADNVESLCRDHKLRPLYKVNCLPGVGYEWLARQAKAINRMEKGFRQCCKKKQNVDNCANLKWREELNKFCVEESGKGTPFHCCDGAGTDRYNCFQNISPDPHYNMTSIIEEPSLNKLCETHKIIKKKFPVGFPLKSFVTQCCHLSELDKNLCMLQKINKLLKPCSMGKTSPPAVHRCCIMSSQLPEQCISRILMNAITKANTVLRQKKKKKCPFS